MRLLILLVLATSLTAQTPAPVGQPEAAKPDPAKQPAKKFFEVPQFDLYTRYRYIDNSPLGNVTADDVQYRFTWRFRANLHATGTSLNSRVESGSVYNSSWTNTGLGRGRGEWKLNAKTFYLSQKLGKHAAIDVGAMDIDLGTSSEATYSDNDGYTEGYRLRLVDLKHRLAPSRVTMTFGYIGGFNRMNAFSRLHRMDTINYFALMAEKHFNKRVTASAEFDRLEGINLFRTAGKFKLPDSWLVHDAQLETVVRMNGEPTAGWAAFLTRTKGTLGKFNPGIFYTHLPVGVYRKGTAQVIQNGDIYATGKRLGFTTKYQINKELDVTTFVARRLDSDPGPRWRAQIALRYQLAPWLNKLLP